MDVVVDGFAHPDGVGVPSHEEFPRDVVDRAMGDFTAAGAVPYVALCDGAVAGGGSMRLTDGVAQLTGAATAPVFRVAGVQAALLAVRLRDAARAGCDNRRRRHRSGVDVAEERAARGFQLLYTRRGAARTRRLIKLPRPVPPRAVGRLGRRGVIAPASQGSAAVNTCVANGQSWRPVVGTTEHVMPLALPSPHSVLAA